MDELVPKKRYEEGSVMTGKDSSIMRHENLVAHHVDSLHSLKKMHQDIVITLRLIMNNYKTIDGRRVNVHIAKGACITIHFDTTVIIHGLHIHDCKPIVNAMVRSPPSHFVVEGGQLVSKASKNRKQGRGIQATSVLCLTV